MLIVGAPGGVLVIVISFGQTCLFPLLLLKILLTSYDSTNLNSACQEMEVSAEGATVNCFCLTHFGKASPATVNFTARLPPIGDGRQTVSKEELFSSVQVRRRNMSRQGDGLFFKTQL